MTSLDAAERPALAVSPALFAATVFASASLVFMVQPMAARLVLPLLGGSPSVWNASMAFFQAALLVGYLYAHLLQRIPRIRAQALIHGAVLLAAAIALPLRVNALFGPPSSDHPTLWLLGVLTVSIGAPFAMLSATAPLVQAWYARVCGDPEGGEPYALYAASNLGSLIALLAYPLLVEPNVTVHDQTLGWSLAYGAFVLVIGALAMIVARSPESGLTAAAAQDAPRVTWRERATWTTLAAIPSSLMLGVTAYLATDVASAPFLWVAPLALYLATFIIAFQARPAIPPKVALVLQAGLVCACVAMAPFATAALPAQVVVHLATFFFTALVCHQALVARRPPPARLTEFYLCLSLGGVLGGGFNAFLAPVIFSDVVEYPLVLALACLARPWSYRQVGLWRWGVFMAGVGAVVAAPIVGDRLHGESTAQMLLAFAALATFLNQGVLVLFFALIVMLSVSAHESADRAEVTGTWRSFFGVLRETQTQVPGLGGAVRMLSHGTTLHGAQALSPDFDCRPLTYYAPETPLGQVFVAARADKPALRIGAVGLGTGSVAAYVRPADRLTFFEIDPLVVRISTDPRRFSYTTKCAKGPIDYVIGDARLTLAKQPKDAFDILLLDAFSSDSVPAHLLTVEAVKSYLQRLKPDGVLVLHLSNRNLVLAPAATAVVEAAGGRALYQMHGADPKSPPLWESPVEAMIVARGAEGLAPYINDGRWETPAATRARPWTDDYTNLPGALYGRLKTRWSWLP